MEIQTKLMHKLFVDQNSKFNKKVIKKLEEAEKKGSSELIYRKHEYQFAYTKKCWVIEDKRFDELTQFRINPENAEDCQACKVSEKNKYSSNNFKKFSKKYRKISKKMKI
jgi:hypothetical protein